MKHARRQAVDGHLLNMILPIFAGSLEFFTFGWKRCPFVNFGILFEWICHLFKTAASYFSYEAKAPWKKTTTRTSHPAQARKERSLVLGCGRWEQHRGRSPKNTSAEV